MQSYFTYSVEGHRIGTWLLDEGVYVQLGGEDPAIHCEEPTDFQAIATFIRGLQSVEGAELVLHTYEVEPELRLKQVQIPAHCYVGMILPIE